MNNWRKFAQPNHFWFYMAIALFASLLYANTLNHGFVFDDRAVLSKNSFVQEGLGGLSDIFTKGSWDGFDASADMHIYRPLQLAFLALQFEFFELQPRGYHAVHVGTYALLCCLIFALLRRLFCEAEHGAALAFLATIIYAAHPVHTEVVANIKGNGDLIAMLLGVASLICIWKHSQTKSMIQLAAGTGLFLLALLTKETIVCLVGVAALMLYTFTDRSVKQTIVTVAPMLMMVLIYLGIRSLVFGSDAQTLTQTTQYDNFVLMADGLSQELGLRLYALGKNLQLCLAPYPLQFMYVYDSVPMVEFWDIRSLFPLAAYALIGLALLINLRKNNIWGFAIGFFLITLALFTNTVIAIPNIVSERWLLMPSLGAAIAVAYALVLLWRHNRKAATSIALLILIGYSGYTIERNKAWESELTLFETDVETAPRNAMANRFLATLHLSEADAAESDKNAVEHVRKSAYYQERFVELAPNDAAQHHKLGKIYVRLGEHRKAAETFKKVAGYVSPLQEAAELLYAKHSNAGGLYRDALPIWAELKKRDPDSAEVAVGHTVALFKTGQEAAAEASFRKLLELVDPHESGNTPHVYLNNLGIQFEEMGANEMAASAFGLAASYDSQIQGKAAFSQAKNLNLAKIYSEAVPLWIKLDQDYPDVLDVLIGKTTALIGSGRRDDALEAAEELDRLIKSESVNKLTDSQYIAINSIAVAIQNWGAHGLAAGLFGEAAGADSPVRGKAMFSQARSLNLAQSYGSALPIWSALEREYPAVGGVLTGKARALEGLSRKTEAIKVYKEALVLIRANSDGKGSLNAQSDIIEKINALESQ